MAVTDNPQEASCAVIPLPTHPSELVLAWPIVLTISMDNDRFPIMSASSLAQALQAKTGVPYRYDYHKFNDTVCVIAIRPDFPSASFQSPNPYLGDWNPKSFFNVLAEQYQCDTLEHLSQAIGQQIGLIATTEMPQFASHRRKDDNNV